MFHLSVCPLFIHRALVITVRIAPGTDLCHLAHADWADVTDVRLIAARSVMRLSNDVSAA